MFELRINFKTMKKLYIPILTLLSIFSNAQTVLNTKLHEINFGASSDPKSFIKLNDLIIFPATRSTDEGRELWCFNSTTQKSSLLKDIYPGPSAGISGSPASVKLNNKVYFLAQQNSSFYQLWVTDGTSIGTTKLKDLSSNFVIDELVVVGNKIFFYQNNELWAYDTLTDALQSLKTFTYSGNVKLYSFHNQLFLAANDGVYGKEIWKSDGTPGGTTLLKDIASSSGSSISNDFKIIELNNKFYFVANGAAGYELYESDGTTAGTVSVTPVKVPELDGAASDNYFVFKGLDPVGSGIEPWVSDGTAAGTKLLKDIIPGVTSSLAMPKFISFNNKIYFESNSNGITPNYGNYIWETDGTLAGTALFGTPPEMKLYGKSSDGIHLILNTVNSGLRYWITNGGSVQPFEITGLALPVDNSFIDLNSKVYLAGTNQRNGGEVFSLDPATKVISIATDINRVEGSEPHSFDVLNNNLIFIAKDREFSNQLYKRNKSTQQVERLSFFNTGGTLPGGIPTTFDDNFTKVGNYLYTKGGFYRTDGTAAGSNVIIMLEPITNRIVYTSLNDNVLLFSAYSNSTGTELWRINNSSNTMDLVKDISVDNMGSLYDVDTKTAVLNGYAYFIARQNGKLGIWKSDGTNPNTNKTIQFTYQNGTDGDIKVLSAVNNKLFFTLARENNSSNEHTELWSSDGDQASSVLLKSYVEPTGSGTIYRETGILNDKLFYVTTGFSSGLHSSDGTVAGTEKIVSGNFSPNVKFQKCGNQLFFTNNYDKELWKTDGTATGTYMVKSGFSGIKDMVCTHNYLYFLNGDSQKVWKTNGSASDTVPMDVFVTNDDNQLLANENIQKMATDGEELFLTIFTKEHGSEFYAITDTLPVYMATNESIKQEGKNANLDIKIYPNPVSDYFSIHSKENDKIETVKIFDAAGKLVKNITYSNDKIDVAELSSGIYFLRIKTAKGDYLGKILKK